MTSTDASMVPDTASGVLGFARGRRAAADRAEADLLAAAVQWALLHPAETLDDAETFRLRSGGESGLPVAGPGAPLVQELAIAEFAAAVGMGTGAGQYYVGHALELAHRLPRLWKMVQSGELDLADALDLDDAIRGIAAQLAHLGSTESLDVRRSLAAGELARRQLTLGLSPQGPEVEVRAQRASKPVRKTVLHLHLSEAALTGADPVGRAENTRCPVTAEQIRDWCGHPATHLTINPVIDLADHVHTDAYEVPDRIKERLALRDHTCVFPWCTRPARNLQPDGPAGCDCDHVTPYRAGGPPDQTCTCRLAPLCRTHHRLKTHAGWTLSVLEPGSYRWTSPHGYTWHRDHTGTTATTPDRQPSPRP